jgi:hypothetical protein
MTTHVDVDIPSSFISERLTLTLDEMEYGLRHGWIGRQAVIELCATKFEEGLASPREEELALALSGDADRLEEMIDDETPLVAERDKMRLWLYLILAWIYERRNSIGDPLGVVEMVYADFDYPDEIAHLVRYMPPLPGNDLGAAALMSEWKSYIDEETLYLRNR